MLLKSWLKSDIGILGQIICVMFLDIFNPEALRLNVKLYMKMLDKSLLGRVRFRHIPSSNVYNSYQYFSLLSLHKIRLNTVTLLKLLNTVTIGYDFSIHIDISWKLKVPRLREHYFYNAHAEYLHNAVC